MNERSGGTYFARTIENFIQPSADLRLKNFIFKAKVICPNTRPLVNSQTEHTFKPINRVISMTKSKVRIKMKQTARW